MSQTMVRFYNREVPDDSVVVTLGIEGWIPARRWWYGPFDTVDEAREVMNKLKDKRNEDARRTQSRAKFVADVFQLSGLKSYSFLKREKLVSIRAEDIHLSQDHIDLMERLRSEDLDLEAYRDVYGESTMELFPRLLEIAELAHSQNPLLVEGFIRDLALDTEKI